MEMFAWVSKGQILIKLILNKIKYRLKESLMGPGLTEVTWLSLLNTHNHPILCNHTSNQFPMSRVFHMESSSTKILLLPLYYSLIGAQDAGLEVCPHADSPCVLVRLFFFKSLDGNAQAETSRWLVLALEHVAVQVFLYGKEQIHSNSAVSHCIFLRHRSQRIC